MFKIVIVLLISTVVVCGQGQTSRDYRNGYSPPVTGHTLPANPGLWEELHPKIPRTDYIGLAFFDEQTGWATGAGGAIIKTTNAGVNWVKKQGNTTATLTTIATHNGVDVIAAGFGGTFLYSSDGGETWMQKTLPTTANFWNLRFVTERIVWLCGEGGNLFRSEDGGITWSTVTTPLGNTAYWDVFFVDSLYGFVGSNGGKLLKTTDGGQSWSVKQAGYAQHIYTVAAPDRNHITVAGAFQKLSYSSDCGETWIDHPAGSPPHYNKAVFVNDTLGYIVGSGTDMARTTNKGANWTFKPTEYYEWNICFPTEEVGYIAGEDMALKKTTNRGYEWDYMVINKNVTAVQHVSENQVFVLAEQLYKSTDKGVTFTRINPAIEISSIHFLDSLTGFRGMLRNRIMKTTDGGVTWHQKPIAGLVDTNTGRIDAIQFYNSQIGWAGSYNSGIIKTTDRGESWFVQTTAARGRVIQTFDSLTVYTLAAFLYKTTNGGQTWQQFNLPAVRNSDLYFRDTLNGLLVTEDGLQKTTNGGMTWTVVPDIIGMGDGRFDWFDESHGLIVGNHIYETRDGGDHWQRISSQVNERLAAFHSYLPNMGYGIGGYGLIMRYIDTAYVPVTLHSLSYSLNDNIITLRWQTSSEANNSGFEVERSFDGIYFEKIGFVKGNGTTTEPQPYTFTDRHTTSCFYRLRQIDHTGLSSYSDTIEVKENLEVAGLSLVQNFPNPFNPVTKIEFALPEQSDISLKVYDILGKEVAILASGSYSAGRYTVPFDGTNHASGIYFCEMKAGAHKSIIKMILIK